MKKRLLLVLTVFILIIGIWIVCTGFRKEASAFVDDFSVDNTNSIMTVHTGVGSSVGSIRKVAVNQNEEGEVKLDFISSFGGINGSIGAKSTYDIPLDKKCKSISIYQGDHYRLILKKDANSGEWIPVSWNPSKVLQTSICIDD